MTTIGVFVGGRGRRMGGVPKGLLRLRDGTTILDRTVALARQVSNEVVLVGRSDDYDVGLPSLADSLEDAGPLAGLLSLLRHCCPGQAVALACDMPYLTLDLLRRLATTPRAAPVVAARRGERWEPLFARYDAAPCLPAVEDRLARRELSLQGLLGGLGAEALPLLPGEATLLDDWDRPEDIA